MFRPKLIAALCLGALAPLAQAQAAVPDQACTVKTRGATVLVMVCPAASDSSVWRAAGEAACGAAQRCNVWVWDDASKAPATAPASDADLPKAAAGAAVAIWVNDSKSLVSLKRVDRAKNPAR